MKILTKLMLAIIYVTTLGVSQSADASKKGLGKPRELTKEFNRAATERKGPTKPPEKPPGNNNGPPPPKGFKNPGF